MVLADRRTGEGLDTVISFIVEPDLNVIDHQPPRNAFDLAPSHVLKMEAGEN